jgi:poly-beta-1,6 N-acetyl-D-glucosamine synthase
MSSPRQIFFDPSGKRKKIARVSLIVSLIALVTATIVGMVLFLGSPLLTQSQLNALAPNNPSNLVVRAEVSPELLKQSRDEMVRELEQTRALSKLRKVARLERRSTAFVNTLNERSLAAIRTHAEDITAISPAWLLLNDEGGRVSDVLFQTGLNPISDELRSLVADKKLALIPRLIDVPSEATRANRLESVFPDRQDYQIVSTSVASFLDREDFPQILVDIRTSTRQSGERLTEFVQTLAATCSAMKRHVGIVVFLDDLVNVAKLAPVIDSVVLVNSFGAPNRSRVSSLTAFSNKLQSIEQVIPVEKISVALGSGALQIQGKSTIARGSLTFTEALTGIQANAIQFDPQSGTSSYRSQRGLGDETRTWILDAPFSFNTKRIAEEGAVDTFGIWDVGGEDSGLWELLAQRPTVSELEHLPPTDTLSTTGRGDILTPRLDGRTDGARRIHVDEQTGLITKVLYESIPTSAGTAHTGYREKAIALTFDDGPAEPYTSQILDILKRNKVAATFFVMGEHVLEHPKLLQRIYDEGHDIGNHSFSHPDLSLVTKNRVALELNAAQRAIQSVLGRSVTLFRPPYISESSPLSSREFRVITIAHDLGYSTVGISNNGRDWIKYDAREDGSEYERTGDDVAEEILSKIELMPGNAILLHDGPKERENSVAAVAILIPKLKALGYSFITIHELMGVPRETIFPVVTATPYRHAYQTFLHIVSWGSDIVSGIFIVIVVIGIIRFALILVCAILARRDERLNPCSPEEIDAARDIPVSIIIAAYNEEKVIANTISSLLKGNHRNYEIIVVDDGSKDGTSAVVRDTFDDDPRVTLITQSNGGKSAALNHGIQHAKTHILVCLDADTQFDADAVTYMARHFLDQRIGAVAGNIKVGNRHSILTHWQSMEYITNISIGRRAYGYLNAITVVAGAAGAWRRKAIEQSGGYHTDSLAEDMDMTWRIRKSGWDVVNEPLAIGYTEAPENFRGLYKQRFRWSYGALQCLWKHRDALGRHGFFGWFGVPSIFIFGCVFEILAPLADLKMLLALISFVAIWFSDHPIYPGSLEYTDLIAPMITTAWLYLLFFGVELMISVLAFRLDREDMRPLWLLFFQRFIYRQLMYIVAWRALWKAITGWRQGWGTLQRTGTVLPPSHSPRAQ